MRRLDLTHLDTKNVELVGLVHLLQEDEGQHCVGTQTEVVRSEAFP